MALLRKEDRGLIDRVEGNGQKRMKRKRMGVVKRNWREGK